MGEPTGDGLVKITVFLTREAFDALEAAADREGISRTDAVNLALQAWDQLTARPGAPFTYQPEETR